MPTKPAVPTRRTARELSAADPELAPWTAFLHAHARVTRRLDDELRAGHGISLAEYDALLQIAHAPERRLRMNLLAERVLLSRSGVTRLVDRLVEAGMVERRPFPGDARGAEAALTPTGLARLREAARTHLDGIARWFLDPIDPIDLPALERGLTAVVDRLGCGETCGSHAPSARED